MPTLNRSDDKPTPGMQWDGYALPCPICSSRKLKVVESRPHAGTLRRRRHCETCGAKFWTVEIWSDWKCTGVPEDQAEASREKPV